MNNGYIVCQNPHGNHRMAYVTWGTPSQGKPAVVCVHGLTRNGRDFDRLAQALAETGRFVICPDIVGRGKSEYLIQHPELYGYPQYMADMSALMAELGISACDWVGTSMGALIGMMLAATPDNKLRKLVINDVGPFIPVAGLKRIAAYVGMPVEFATRDRFEKYIRQIYAPFGITREEDWKLKVEHSYRVLPNGKITLAHDPGIAKNFAALKEDVDLWSIYDAVKIPTLVLRGETSDVLSANIADEMTKRGPKAQLVTYRGIGHAPALMDEKQIGDILAFLG